jgi:hypothetical protein
MELRALRELPGDGSRLVQVSCGEVHVRQGGEQGRRRRARPVEWFECTFEDVTGDSRPPAGELDRGTRTRGAGIVVESFEQLLGFLEPALTDPEVGQPNERSGPQRAVTEAPQPHGVHERLIGLGPASRRRQHAAVVRPAERRHRRQVPAPGDVLTDADPLIGPPDVVGVLTGREQLAEDLFEHGEVVDLVPGDRGQGLVEQVHPLLGAIGVHPAGAEVGQRHQLEVGVADRPGDGQRRGEVLLLARPVSLEHAAVERHPTRLGRVGGGLRLRPCDPAVHDRPVAQHRTMHERQRSGDADRSQLVTRGAVRAVGMFPRLDRAREVLLEVGRPGQPLHRVAVPR